MSETRMLALACAGVATAWAIGGLFLSSREGPCNPNDVTGCDTVGWVLLYGLMFVLPAVFLVLAGVLIIGLIARWFRSRRR